MRAYCVILAGGLGSRMGGDVPKQFMSLGGVPIILRTIRRVLECAQFDKIIVAIHPSWRDVLSRMLNGDGIDKSRILVTSGGGERIDSILNSLKAIHEQTFVSEEDIAVIHDAVRPFVSVDVLEKSIKAACESGACVAVLPAVDTMLEVSDGMVVAVPSRARIFHGQAPDSARILLLERAINDLSAEERRVITGTAQILVAKGIPVRTISGDRYNMKITTPADIEIAESFLAKGVR